MSDQIGAITVPEVSPSGTFNLGATQYGHALQRDYRVQVHQMDNTTANLKIEQRFLLGTGARKFTWRRDDLSYTQKTALEAFYDSHKGPYIPFTYAAPNDDGAGFTNCTVTFANEPLTISQATAGTWSAQCTFLEIPTSFPTYTLNSTQTRFPAGDLPTKLQEQEQEWIPLIHIVVAEIGYPDNIFLSDRRCTVGSQLYQARYLRSSEITQAIGSKQADVASFTFGNADDVMRQLGATKLTGARIEFSEFNPDTGIKLDIWAGRVLSCTGETTSEFTIEAGDPIDLGVQAPERKVSHSCWKPWNDGLNCIPPGTLNGSFPDATLASCDKTWDGGNGCQAHNNDRQFGGHPVGSELVRIKTGGSFFGLIGRRLTTAAPLIADTAYNSTLPEHYCDIPMLVNGAVLSGRDESQFFIALIIIGAGPLAGISSNIFDHKLDGQSSHGPGLLGFRASNGPDPAATSTPGSIIIPGDNDHYFNLDENSWPPAIPRFAAGTAFVTLRRTDEEGIQLRPITEHQAQIMLTGGLGCWTWTDVSTRVLTLPSVNPVWVAVNRLFRSKYLFNASAGNQTPLFDIPSAIASAAICSDVVEALVAGRTQQWVPEDPDNPEPNGGHYEDVLVTEETQFRFVGTIGEQQGLRETITSILNGALGGFTFVFGKFKPFIRCNSSAVEAFTAGNIIRDSLQLEQFEAEFNALTVEYNDQESGFAKNTVDYNLEDHVKLFGLRPKTLTLSGVVSKSQALRVGATQVREKCGGIDATQWAAARRGAFMTTILGIGSEPGQVDSLTHGKMPGGYGEFRIERWTYNPSDKSLRLEWQTTTDEMYNLVEGPKPADVTADPLPVERTEEVIPIQPWFPNEETPDVDDPLYSETDKTFGLQQLYPEGGAGEPIASVRITGAHAITEVLACPPPLIGAATTFSTGGAIAADAYVTIVLVATDVDGNCTRASRAIGLHVDPGGSSAEGMIRLSGITWPAECAGGSYRLYASIDRGVMSEQLTSEGSSEDGQPSSIDLTELLNIRTRGLPQQNLLGLVPMAKHCWHAGIDGRQVAGINTDGSLHFPGAGWTPTEMIGRFVSIYADASDGSAPPWNFTITGNDDENLLLDPDPATVGVGVGDVCSILAQATDHSSNTIGDSKFTSQYPDGFNNGGKTNGERGRIVEIIHGTGKDQERLIVLNTATVLTIADPWAVEPDGTSTFIIKEATWGYIGDVVKLGSGATDKRLEINLPVANLIGDTMLVEVAAVDHYGRQTTHAQNPWRLIYMFGSVGNIANSMEVSPAYLS